MTEPAVSLAFFDPAHELHGSLRAGLSLLFERREPAALSDGAEVSIEGNGFRARLAGHVDLRFEPRAEKAELAGAEVQVCAVSGTVGNTVLDCLGTATVTRIPPAWAELDAVRFLSAIADTETAVMAVARRPREAAGHGSELVHAALLSAGELHAVEDARISTVYDGDGRQRTAGLELWLPGEDFPRRVSGSVGAGTTLALEGLRVNAAVFTWRLEGREAFGAYDVMVRDEAPIAA